MRAQQARRRLRDFVRWSWPVLHPTRPLKWGWHLDAICDHLQAVSERRVKNLVINLPPRCLKSTIAAVCWPAWHWAEWPEESFITASYKLSLAVRDAVCSRRIIESRQYRAAWGGRFRLTTDQNEKSRYENDRTGVRLTTSVGGGTGDGGEFSLLDDPHNVEEAESAAVLESTRRWHDEAFYSRVNDPKAGGRVVIGHRVSPKDLSGHLLEMGGWVHLKLPEEYDPGKSTVTSLGWKDPRVEPGQLLRPDTFGPEENAQVKANPFAHAAQHNQNPVPREGVLYKSAWFATRRYQTRESGYLVGGAFVPRQDCRLFALCDPAGGTSSAAAYTACLVFACTPVNDLLVLSALRERIDLEEIVPRLHTECDRWPGLLFLGMEDGFLQRKLIEQARRRAGMVAVKALATKGKDKVARSIPALTRAQAGQIWLPDEADAPWAAGFFARVLAFTGLPGTEADEGDCLGYAAQIVQSWDAVAGAAPRARGGMPRG